MSRTTQSSLGNMGSSCFAISFAASQLAVVTVSSNELFPIYFPVLTSITVIASVVSIMSDPPDLRSTFFEIQSIIKNDLECMRPEKDEYHNRDYVGPCCIGG